MAHFSRLFPIAALALGALTVHAEERQVTIYGGGSTALLGSEDSSRRGAGIGLSVLRNEPRFAIGPYRGQVKYEVNYMISTSPGLYEFDPDRTDAIGALALYRASRYHYDATGVGTGIYAEVGLGLQYSSQGSHDLPLQFNTTPTFGLGYRFPVARRAVELGIRYFHVSNGGRKEPNGGQNWIFATLSVAF